MRAVPETPRTRALLEIALVAAILAASFRFLSERIAFRTFPDGDEGSWMSVAAEVSRGNGFTTRWLEHPFLVPYALPRPDDFRYPGLTVCLAAAFRVFGVSYHTALWTVGGVFLAFCAGLYLTLRTVFGVRTAAISLLVTSASLLQLYWNTQVYTEGLFGLVLCLLIFFAIKLDAKTLRWWIVTGMTTGLLFLIRPNAMLFLPGFMVIFCVRWRRDGVLPVKHCSVACLCAAAIMAPWLIRNAVDFGNPFHLAGSAGLLRLSYNDPVTLTPLVYIRHYGIAAPFVSTVVGAWRFFGALDFFEHGMHILPCLFVLVGLALRMPFYNGFVISGFTLSFMAASYVSYMTSWGGVRYFASALPFIYAYGIHAFLRCADRLTERFTGRFAATAISACIVAAVSVAPVVYPHRYYERRYAGPAPGAPAFDAHRQALSSLLSKGESYYANAYGQLNFLTEYSCVGIQGFFDSSEVQRSLDAFSPKAAVLTDAEMNDARVQAIVRELGRNGYSLALVDSVNTTGYYSLKHAGP